MRNIAIAAFKVVKPYNKQDGTKSLANIVDFRDNKTKYLMQDEVLPIVIAAFAEGGR